MEKGGVVWSETAVQAELTWSAQGGVSELTRGQDSGGSALTDDPLLETLRQMPRTSLILTHSPSSGTSHLGIVMG